MQQLSGSVCSACGEMFYPSRLACPRCGNREMGQQIFSGKGDVYSYTVMREPPARFPRTPYVVALVHLVEGPYVTAGLKDVEPAALFIGMPLEVESVDVLTFRPRRSLVD